MYMSKYQNAKIYKLWSPQGEDVYIGSTTTTLEKRLFGHKCLGKCYSKILYDKYDDIRIELIEPYPCNSKKELYKREGEIMKKYNCVNKVMAGRTVKEYQQDNKEKIIEYQKKYRGKNKDKIKEYQKEYRGKNKDKSTEYMKEYTKEYMKEYYKNNKEKLIQYQKNYYETNIKKKS